MKNHFRYGYDPWMIGMTIVILIVEASGFFLSGETAYDPFANISFWLLTLYIISMIAMFLSACFIKNEAFQNERAFYKSPFNVLVIVILIVTLVIGAIFQMLCQQNTLIIPILLAIIFWNYSCLKKEPDSIIVGGNLFWFVYWNAYFVLRLKFQNNFEI